jgi:type IV secretion system protein TrbJ
MPKRDYYCQSRRGNRLFELGLGRGRPRALRRLLQGRSGRHRRDPRRAWPRRLPRRLAAPSRRGLGRRSDPGPRTSRHAPPRPPNPTQETTRKRRPHHDPHPPSRRASIPRAGARPPWADDPRPSPAQAFFGGFGRIVYDPRNHAENILSAARALEQINNQIAQLQNEAQMLINQARNLASLPHSSLASLQQNVGAPSSFWPRPRASPSTSRPSTRPFSAGLRQHRAWPRPEASFDAMMPARAGRPPSAGCRTRCACRPASSAISTASAPKWRRWSARARTRSARCRPRRRATSFSRCNRQQIADLTAPSAANGRAEALAEAERAAAAEQGRVQRERFLDPGRGLPARHARMFNN